MKNKNPPDVITIRSFVKTQELGRLLGKRETIDILRLLEKRPKKYTELEIIVDISHTSLQRRLSMLQLLDIVKKRPIRSRKRETHEYELTNRGSDLMKFIESYERDAHLPVSQQKIIEVEKK